MPEMKYFFDARPVSDMPKNVIDSYIDQILCMDHGSLRPEGCDVARVTLIPGTREDGKILIEILYGHLDENLEMTPEGLPVIYNEESLPQLDDPDIQP